MLYKNILVALSLSIGFLPVHGMYRANASTNRRAAIQRRQEQKKLQEQQEQEELKQQQEQQEASSEPSNNTQTKDDIIKNIVDNMDPTTKDTILEMLATSLSPDKNADPKMLLDKLENFKISIKE